MITPHSVGPAFKGSNLRRIVSLEMYLAYLRSMLFFDAEFDTQPPSVMHFLLFNPFANEADYWRGGFGKGIEQFNTRC